MNPTEGRPNVDRHERMQSRDLLKFIYRFYLQSFSHIHNMHNMHRHAVRQHYFMVYIMNTYSWLLGQWPTRKVSTSFNPAYAPTLPPLPPPLPRHHSYADVLIHSFCARVRHGIPAEACRWLPLGLGWGGMNRPYSPVSIRCQCWLYEMK